MNSLFISPGTEPYAHLYKHLTAVPKQAFEGVWATLELQPDVFSRQKYTVGVVVVDLQGQLSFQLLDDFGKFECLFGKEYVAGLRTLIDSAEQTLLRAKSEKQALQNVHFDSEGISLGELWPTSGSSANEVVHRLYLDVVPFVPTEEKRSREFVPMDNATVRQLVENELKRIAGIKFEQIVTAPDRFFLDSTSGESHRFEFNLETSQKVGNTISAVYKTPDRVELNFLRASRDLTTYTRLKNLKNPAIFVMAPSDNSMPRDDRMRIENVMDEQSWSLEKQGFRVSAHQDAAALAGDILEWAEG